MEWVKRNLGLVIGGVVAVALLLFSGYYLYSNSKKNSEARAQLEGEYKELQRLSNLKPHPGKGDVDNIRRAREQREQLRQAIEQVASRFEPIPAIPASTNVTGEDFSASLRRTIDQLTRQARAASVIVPTNYNFSFEAEKRLVKFAPGSLDRLAVQLGEVRAICNILFEAKVNQLTALRRERVSPDDLTGPQTDYTARTSTTNDLAVISPYEISFESFSAELAAVVAGFANSPHGLVIQGINVRPARSVPAAGSRFGRNRRGDYTIEQPIYTAPVPTAQTQPYAGRYGPGGAPAGRYGPGGDATGGIRRPTFDRPTFAQPGAVGGTYADPYAQPAARPTYAVPRGVVDGTGTGASETLIDEHPLSVSLVVDVIKLLPRQDD